MCARVLSIVQNLLLNLLDLHVLGAFYQSHATYCAMQHEMPPALLLIQHNANLFESCVLDVIHARILMLISNAMHDLPSNTMQDTPHILTNPT